MLRAPTGSTLVQLDDLRTTAELLAGTAVTLFDLAGGRVTHIETLVSDQYAADVHRTGLAADAVDQDAAH